MPDPAMTGETLAAIRTVLDLTQTDLGERLGLSKTEIYRKEAGDRPISAAQETALYGLLVAHCLGRLGYP